MADIDPEKKIAVLKKAVLQLTKQKQDLEAATTALEEKTVIISGELARVNEHNTTLQDRNKQLESEVEELKKKASEGIGSKLLGVASFVPRPWGGSTEKDVKSESTALPQPAATAAPEQQEADSAQLFQQNEALHVELFELKSLMESEMKRLQEQVAAVQQERDEQLAEAAGREKKNRDVIESLQQRAQELSTQLLDVQGNTEKAGADLGAGRGDGGEAFSDRPLLNKHHDPFSGIYNISTDITASVLAVLAQGATSQDMPAENYQAFAALVASCTGQWRASFDIIARGISVLLRRLVELNAQASPHTLNILSLVLQTHRARTKPVHEAFQKLNDVEAGHSHTTLAALPELLTAFSHWLSTFLDATETIVAALDLHIVATHQNGTTAQRVLESTRSVCGYLSTLLGSKLALLRQDKDSGQAAQLLLRLQVVQSTLRDRRLAASLLSLADAIDHVGGLVVVVSETGKFVQELLHQLSSELRRLSTSAATTATTLKHVQPSLQPPTSALVAPHHIFSEPGHVACAAMNKGRSTMAEWATKQPQRAASTTVAGSVATSSSRLAPHSAKRSSSVSKYNEEEVEALRLMVAAADAKAVEYNTTALHLLAELEDRSKRLEAFQREVHELRHTARLSEEERAVVAESYEEQIRLLSERLAELMPAAE